MQKDFDTWNKKKKRIHESTFSNYIHLREVWWCTLGVNIGVEADGKHDNFERPVLVIQKFSRDAVLIVPLTTRIKDNPYHVVYTHDGKQFAAVISQIRLISTKRLIRKVFSMNSGTFEVIRSAIVHIAIKRPPLSRRSRRPHGH
jgi:mRNA interferase MazF